MDSQISINLKHGITVVLIANIINLIVSLLRNFLLPKFLPVETYADIKLYQLYVSYAGFAALGYIDGMYLKYGGKRINEIDNLELNNNISTFRIFQIIASALLLVIGIIHRDFIFCMMSLSIIALNMADYFKCFYQATGEFSAYSRIMNVSSVSLFLASLVILFVFKVGSSSPYILSYVIIYYLVWIYLEVRLRSKGVINEYTSFSLQECRLSIQSGWSLMIGTFISTFMTGLDRWCVKFTMDTYSFALYSFAASVVGFLTYAISPIAITLYNYFCRDYSEINYTKIRKMILVFVSFIIIGAFPILFILEHFLDKYYFAKDIVFILFAGQVFYGFVKCYYVNLYKAKKLQNRYLKGIVIVAISGVVFNVALYLMYKEMISFSIGTMLAGCLWMYLCNRDFREYKNTISEIMYILILVASFIAVGMTFRSYIGFMLYLLIWISMNLIFMRSSFFAVINVAFGSLRRRISQ